MLLHPTGDLLLQHRGDQLQRPSASTPRRAPAPRVIGRALTTGRSLVDIQSWPERIEAVTVEQINRVARQVFEPRNSVTGLLVGEAPDQADAPG